MLEAYRKAAAERAALGIPPLPLTAQQTADLVELLKNPPAGEGEFLVELLAHRVPPGVDDAAKVKASFLAAVAEGSASSPLISPEYATELLGTMLGGYNIHALIELLDNDKLAPIAANGLKHTLLMFDSFHDVQEKAEKGNKYAQEVLQSWADAEWFTSRAKVPEKITVTVFKVDGETNTDDLSPAPDAWSRPDIPLHALAMLKNPRERHSRPTNRAKSVRLNCWRNSKPKAIRLLTSAMWSVPVLHANLLPTPSFGTQAKIFRSYRTNVSAVYVWVAKLLLFSSTLKKTPAHCRLKSMYLL